MHLEMTNKICALCKHLVATNGHPDSTRLCEECRSLIQTILPKPGRGSFPTVEQTLGFAQPQLATIATAQPALAGSVSFEENMDDVGMDLQPGRYELTSFDPVADFDEVQANRTTDIEIEYLDEFEASDEGDDLSARALPDPIDGVMDQSGQTAEQEPEVFIMSVQPEDMDDRASAFESMPSEKRHEFDQPPDEDFAQTISLPHAIETNTQADFKAEPFESMEAAGEAGAISDTENSSYKEAIDPWDDPLPAWEQSRNEYPLYVGISERKHHSRLKTLLVPAVVFVCLVAAYFIFQSSGRAPQNHEALEDSGQGNLESSLPVATPQASDLKPDSQDAQQAASTSSDAAAALASEEKKNAPVASAAINNGVETQWQHSLQALASQSADEANTFAEKLKSAGIPAYVIPADIGNRGRWFRVRIGGFNTPQEAQNFAAEARLRAKAAGVTLKDLNLVDYIKP
jgi:cell division septation protein DedD